jgi:hypothetical protein
MMDEAFFEPCEGEITYREITTRFGARVLVATCACGKEVGSHLLKNESEIRYPHCERVITEETAKEGISELLLCHRKGVVYDAYMGFWSGAEEMTEEEYAVIRERLEV